MFQPFFAFPILIKGHRMDQAKKRAKLIKLCGDAESVDFNQLKHKCQECGKLFTRKSTMLEHNLATHSSERPFECTMCHKTYKQSIS